MLKIGLTGGIACGKTTVAEMFEQLGSTVLYADRIAHRLSEPGQPAYNEILGEFGGQILGPDGRVDRKRLGAIVFSDPTRLERLNQILHPRVIAILEDELVRLESRQPEAVAIVEAALLIESGYHRRLDKLIVVWCEPSQQIERLRERFGLSSEAAHERITAQMPIEEKRRYADYEIDCSNTLAETRAQVERLDRAFRAMVAARA